MPKATMVPTMAAIARALPITMDMLSPRTHSAAVASELDGDVDRRPQKGEQRHRKRPSELHLEDEICVGPVIEVALERRGGGQPFTSRDDQHQEQDDPDPAGTE